MATTAQPVAEPDVGGDAAVMRAWTQSAYGGPDVLSLATVPRPSPAAAEVLVRVRATGVNAGDWHLMRGSPYLIRLIYGGYRRPSVPTPGLDVAGEVAAVGADVTDVEAGDRVVADLSGHGFGGYAEYVCVPASALVSLPSGVSFEDAASVPTAAVTALQALRDVGGLQAGEAVLVNGASGGVGSFAVQLATSLGAEVTGVASTAKLDAVRSMGADRVVDYAEEDVTALDERYDLVVDTAGSHSMREYARILHPGGRYVAIGGPTGRYLQALVLGPLRSLVGSRRFAGLTMQPNREDLAYVVGLLESGAIDPVIDREYSFEEVPEAIRQLEAGRVVGKLVVTQA